VRNAAPAPLDIGAATAPDDDAEDAA